MKKSILFVAAVALTFAACNKQAEVQNPQEEAKVRMSFAPAKAPQDADPTLADFCNHLDVFIIEGTDTIDVHQTSSDADFGEVELSLNKTKTYKMVAVAHKNSGNASIANNILSFANEKVTHMLLGTTTFSPASTTNVACTMNRIVGQFKLEMTDVVPDGITQLDITTYQTGTRWNLANNTATNVIDRLSQISFTARNNDGSASAVMYILPNNLTESSLFTINVKAKTANGTVVEERTFENVAIRANYKTTYSGQFFVTTPMAFSFSVNDWSEFETVEY